ncbi:unnamed protein product [Owenia fusiformis]|uniref:Uncharacterized protein n=1 Tax=Owenia fusiformis TaxID=6347 RepID=A0A8J1UWY4_OWEFU|nr:unnamed protein product [Owenia fusiformis]
MPENPVTKIKRTLKILGIVTGCFLFIGIGGLIAGIVLLALYAQYWNDMESDQRVLAYVGVGALAVGVVFLAIGGAILFYLIRLYKKMKNLAKGVFSKLKTKFKKDEES